MNLPELNLSRRSVLLAGGAGAALAAAPWTSSIAHADDAAFDQVLVNWRQHLLGASIDPGVDAIAAAIAALDAQVDQFLGLLSTAPDAVFTDLVLVNDGGASESGRHSTTFLRLQTMAEAHNAPGSVHHQSTTLAATIVAGVRKTHDRVYHAGHPPFGNWWSWEIGSAQRLMNIIVLMGAEAIGAELLGQCLAAIDHFIPDIMLDRRLVANRMDLCQSVFLRGALGRSAERIDLARTKLLELFVLVESGNGFYADGSYIDHNDVAYTGTYGAVFLRGFVAQVAMLSATTWQLDQSRIDFVADLVDNTFSPMVFDGLVFDNVRGRALGRWNASSRDDGHAIVAIIAQLSDRVGGARQQAWRARVKGWMQRDSGTDPRLSEAGAGSIRTLSEVVSLHDIWTDAGTVGAAEPVRTQVFGAMARAVHRRPGTALTVSMSKDTIAHYEAYTENLRGLHTGSGMVTLHNDDGTQFTDNFWPTVDPYHLPGTTVDQTPLISGQNGGDRDKDKSIERWAGGAVLNHSWAAIGLKLDAFASAMTAKKSWFTLGDRLVCLGSDSTKAHDLATYPAIADTYVNAGTKAAVNFGSQTTMFTKTTTPDYTRESLLRFDVPAGAEAPGSVTTLKLHAFVLDGAGTESVVAIHQVTSAWDEATVTWNTKPTLGQRLTEVHLDGERIYRTIDLSDHARACALAGRPLDLAFVPDHPAGMPGVSVTISTREHSTQKPQLLVSTPATTAVHTTVENRLDHQGQARAVIVNGQLQPAGDFRLARTEALWVHLAQVGGYVWHAGPGP